MALVTNYQHKGITKLASVVSLLTQLGLATLNGFV